MSYKLADGSLSTDHNIGDKFLVNNGSSTFDKRSVVSLFDDDTSDAPLFKLVSGGCRFDCCDGEKGAYTYWSDLTPLTSKKSVPTKEQPKDSLSVPFCVNIGDISYDQYKELHAKLVGLGFNHAEHAKLCDHGLYSYLGVDTDEDIYHWGCVKEFDNEYNDRENVAVYTYEEIMNNAYLKQRPKKEKKERSVERKTAKAVVYYTDGNSYTINNFLDFSDNGDDVSISYETSSKRINIESGITLIKGGSELEVEISKEHLAGVVIKMINGEDRVIRFHPLFSAKYDVANTKQHKEAVGGLDIETNLTNSATWDFPVYINDGMLAGVVSNLSLQLNNQDLASVTEPKEENFEISEGDFMFVTEITEDQCQEFVDLAIAKGFGRGEGMGYYTVSDPQGWAVSIVDGDIFYGYPEHIPRCMTNNITQKWIEYSSSKK